MVTHSSILAWRIPWTEEPGGVQSMGSQRVGHDWMAKHACKHLAGSGTLRVFSTHYLKGYGLGNGLLGSTTLGTPVGTQYALIFIYWLLFSSCKVTHPSPWPALNTVTTHVSSSPLGSSVHAILQARILEWFTILFSRGSYNPGVEAGSPVWATSDAYIHDVKFSKAVSGYISITSTLHTAEDCLYDFSSMCFLDVFKLIFTYMYIYLACSTSYFPWESLCFSSVDWNMVLMRPRLQYWIADRVSSAWLQESVPDFPSWPTCFYS